MERHASSVHNAGGWYAAFTLVELLCVLIILGMMAMMAAPRYANAVAQNRAAAAARRITMDLALAQRQAKFTTTAQKVMFRTDMNKYVLSDMEDRDHPGLQYEISLSEEPYNATLVLADLGDDVEIIFDGFGVPDTGGTVVIEVGKHRKEITVAEQTGRVSVADVDPSLVLIPLPIEKENPPEQIE